MIPAFAIIDAVSRIYGLPYSGFRKPESKRGNLHGTRLQGDARLTAAYLLNTAGDVTLTDTARLLNYKYNWRLGHRIRTRHAQLFEVDRDYRTKYAQALGLIAQVVSENRQTS